MPPRFSLTRITDVVPLGLLVVIIMGVVSSLYVWVRPSEEREGREMWTFINTRAPLYQEIIDGWDLKGEDQVTVHLVEYLALRRRMMSGFLSGTPVADILEVERVIASAAWRGPLEAVGFVDLTDRLEEEGLLEKLNRPSFSPWTNRGRIFGLPADVHPVLLAYRADVFEAAGINVEELTTWEKFFKATRRLVVDFTGDGAPDQYVMELQETNGFAAMTLILQAGGRFFDENGQPDLDHPANVQALTHIVNWASGEDKVTGDLDLFTGAGNQLRMEGYVLSWLVPDWRSREGPLYMGRLSGKMKLMPLPAWEEGGRRTSVWGGTMLGFPRTSKTFEKDWAFAKRLYLSRDLAQVFWRNFSVITPVKAFWDDPVFDEPHSYYSNQPTGRLFIEQAEDVPVRSSSPFMDIARAELGHALGNAIRRANSMKIDDVEQLVPVVRDALERANANVQRQVDRNIFIAEDTSK
jgi:arabinosaccharide transport system substrate-binding protein